MAKQILAAIAPLLMSVSLTWLNVTPSLVVIIIIALAGAAAFLAIAVLLTSQRTAAVGRDLSSGHYLNLPLEFMKLPMKGARKLMHNFDRRGRCNLIRAA